MTDQAQQQPEQPFLPMDLPTESDQPMPQIYREGRYTLEQVPEPTQKAIVALRGAGYSIQEIAKTLHVHNKTVMAVDRYRPDEIATRKEQAAVMLLSTADLAIGALREALSDPEKLKKISGKDLALITAITTDKGLLMAGESTHKVSVSFEDPGHAAFLQELGRMGLRAGAPGQKGAQGQEPIDVEGVEVSKPTFTSEEQEEVQHD